MSERHAVQHAMDRLYARIHELRDAVYIHPWDAKLRLAAVRAEAAMREFNATIDSLP